jgi:hypothetical protein
VFDVRGRPHIDPLPYTQPDDASIRARLHELGAIRRRFDYRRLYILLRRKDIVMNHKKLAGSTARNGCRYGAPAGASGAPKGSQCNSFKRPVMSPAPNVGPIATLSTSRKRPFQPSLGTYATLSSVGAQPGRQV